MYYDMSKGNFIAWGFLDAGSDAIVAKDGYHKESYTGLDASSMDSIHIDIWSLETFTEKVIIFINDQGMNSLRLSHNGKGWQSYNVILSEFQVAEDEDRRIDNIRWMKIDGFNTINSKIAIDNVYFFKAVGGGTAIENTNAEIKAVKKIENGQLIIIKNGVKYNVAGQQVK